MDDLREEFRGQIRFAPGEELLGCWQAAPANPELHGGIDSGCGSPGLYSVAWGRLALTRFRVVLLDHPNLGHLVQGHPAMVVPLGTVRNVFLVGHRSLFPDWNCLVVRAATGGLLGGTGGVSCNPGRWRLLLVRSSMVEEDPTARIESGSPLRDHFISLGERDDAGDVFQVVRQAVAAARSDTTTRPDTPSARPPGERASDGGFIHLHAEEDPED
jgi:hypothetical protein